MLARATGKLAPTSTATMRRLMTAADVKNSQDSLGNAIKRGDARAATTAAEKLFRSGEPLTVAGGTRALSYAIEVNAAHSVLKALRPFSNKDMPYAHVKALQTNNDAASYVRERFSPTPRASKR